MNEAFKEAVHQWIKEDAPLSMKMTFRAELRDKLLARLEAAEKAAWQPISTAPKDRTSVILRLKNRLVRPGRGDLRDPWEGLTFVGRHPGLADDGFDIGWNFAAPVGHGGFPDEWIAGWRPLPEPPESA